MNTHKHVIGNGGQVQQVHTRSFTGAPPVGGFGQYPGLGGGAPFADFAQGGGLPVPFEGGGGGGFFGGGAPGGGAGGGFLGLGGGAGAGASSNPLSGLNLKQISGFVERMGGIDGIIGTMGKVQKVIGGFQQMAPMMKLLFNSFGKVKSKDSDSDDDFDFESLTKRKRKRKRRRKSSSVRRKTGKSSKKRTRR
ncbi:aminotransferase [Paenibacillus hexagrammi]|uniref:Aminotransferase n=1 Tax=Paenibacillus hexagrammi TaxID=2908839 RepID=A0ABY3SF98_9BACL|nr:aminotransferase [Paenibacillus sp. YPD9-1]UJF32678.1 aminotransferase [Paenibacillus sp. YPD9-1]